MFLRRGVAGRRLWVVCGWALVILCVVLLVRRFGIEVGPAVAATALPVAGLTVVAANLERARAPRRRGERAGAAAAARTPGTGVLRWLIALPVGMAAAITLGTASAAVLSRDTSDGAVAGAMFALLFWPVFAAWGFATRRPLRLAAAIAAAGLCGALAVYGP